MFFFINVLFLFVGTDFSERSWRNRLFRTFLKERTFWNLPGETDYSERSWRTSLKEQTIWPWLLGDFKGYRPVLRINERMNIFNFF
ncbi:hypothetical protein RclHR1_14810005 [Rhizophagus clarus]|uniref:Uncharacterized protein n=1 Tax=Rhizophagus clarus TaxID=94130 RepID=A0A2Z6QFG9_9GLOM|nr:hypothetical protein RclHR1_14810005 [Rhizophagus clarus]